MGIISALHIFNKTTNNKYLSQQFKHAFHIKHSSCLIKCIRQFPPPICKNGYYVQQMSFQYSYRKTQPKAIMKLPEKQKNNKIYKIAAHSILSGILVAYILYTLKSSMENEDRNTSQNKFGNLPSLPQIVGEMKNTAEKVTLIFGEMKNTVEMFTNYFARPSRHKLLPDQVINPLQKPHFTLVLELHGLLLHPEWSYETGWRFKKRPGVDKFLQLMASQNIEVVIFSTEKAIDIWPLVDSLDPYGYIKYRLARDSTHFVEGHHVKNLDSINRDQKKVIVVDWNEKSVQFHSRNCLLLPRWRGNNDDHTLEELATFLQAIAKADPEDVREILDYYKQDDNPLIYFQKKKEETSKQDSSDKIWVMRYLQILRLKG